MISQITKTIASARLGHDIEALIHDINASVTNGRVPLDENCVRLWCVMEITDYHSIISHDS